MKQTCQKWLTLDSEASLHIFAGSTKRLMRSAWLEACWHFLATFVEGNGNEWIRMIRGISIIRCLWKTTCYSPKNGQPKTDGWFCWWFSGNGVQFVASPTKSCFHAVDPRIFGSGRGGLCTTGRARDLCASPDNGLLSRKPSIDPWSFPRSCLDPKTVVLSRSVPANWCVLIKLDCFWP